MYNLNNWNKINLADGQLVSYESLLCVQKWLFNRKLKYISYIDQITLEV